MEKDWPAKATFKRYAGACSRSRDLPTYYNYLLSLPFGSNHSTALLEDL
jgi:hypothetical protein